MNPSKFTLYAKDSNTVGIKYCELSADKIMCNEIPVLPGDYHYHNMRLWIIGHEFGAICAVWSTHEQEAIDCAVDLNLLDCLQILQSEYDAMSDFEKDEVLHAGNASEPFDQTYLWMAEVDFSDIALNWELLKAFARCDDANSLDY